MVQNDTQPQIERIVVGEGEANIETIHELIHNHAAFNDEYRVATKDLIGVLESFIQDQEGEIHRLSDEQIKPLADFLMQQSDAIGHPGDEGACAMAIRVIRELIDGDNRE